MSDSDYTLQPIGVVMSNLKTPDECPKQGWEGAPHAWLEIYPEFRSGLGMISAGHDILIFTWLHEARRDLLQVHPRGDRSKPAEGVFTMRSPHRPNPIGLHRVKIEEIDGSGRIKVYPLEVIDGTPIIDIKSATDDL